MKELRYFSIELSFNYWNVWYVKLKDESSELQRIFSHIALMTQTLQCQGKQTRSTEFKKMRGPFNFSYTISAYLLQFRAILSQFVVLYAVVSLAGTIKTTIIKSSISVTQAPFWSKNLLPAPESISSSSRHWSGGPTPLRNLFSDTHFHVAWENSRHLATSVAKCRG